ncbi:hypothetical protein F4815DRAFT_445678 [Daldinia loculata]|nr:hypothetical protein F4815DRAFT_445678 [Daldinia loculata]
MPPHLRSASARANSGNQSGESSSKGTAKTSKTTATRRRKRKSTDSQSSSRPKRGKQTKASGTEEPEDICDEKHDGGGKVSTCQRASKSGSMFPSQGSLRARQKLYESTISASEKASWTPAKCFMTCMCVIKKGREGSPTYDAAGFQLDWEKVDSWMHPPSYTKSGVVSRIEKVVDKMEREERDMFKIFFVDGKPPDSEPTIVTEYLQDHVSKDLGIPWHQIGPKHLVEWEKRGFPKQKARKWWQEPNEMEERRMMKMSSCAIYRKDL